MKTPTQNNFFIFVLAFVFFISNIAQAATILQSKNNKVLISLDGDVVSVGQNIGFKNAAGKTVAIATVTQVKSGRAIAEVKKGALSGGETIFYGKSSAQAAKPKTEELTSDNISADSGEITQKAPGVYRLKSTRVAGLLTIGLNNMTTKQADGSATPNIEDVALKGTSFGLAGSIDFPVLDWLTAHGTFGFEPFNASGSANFNSCNNLSSTDCNANINYLSTGGYARFNLNQSKLQFWAGLGGTFKFPISKSSTALRTDDIKMTFTFGAAGGADYFISNKYFIPASLEYQMFQSSDTVKANLILLRGGFGMAF